MSPFNQQAVETAAKEAVKLTNAESRSLKVEQFTAQDMRQEILNSEMILKDKTDKNVNVKTSDLISTIIKDIGLTERNTSGQILQRVNAMEIKIGGITLKPGQFGIGSTNVAYIQIALGADPDGYFGRDTLIAAKSMDMVETVNNASNTPENIGEISINMLSQENFYDDFIILLGQEAADKYKDVYKLFNRNGVISSIKINNVMQTVTMEYCYSVANNSYNTISVRIQDIQNPNKNIDKAKFVQEIVKAIDKNEARLNYAQLKKSIEDGVKNIPANKLGNAQYDYVKANGWINTSGNLDFMSTDINSTGMTVEGNELVVKYGTTGLTPAKLDISKIKKANNTFDQDKFVAELQKQSLTKLAQLWIESRMRTYKTNGDKFLLVSNNPVLLDTKVKNMKNWLTETKAFINTLENTYKLSTNAAQKETFKKQIASIEARIWLDDYYKIFKKYTTTTHTSAEMTKTEAEFKQAMTNVLNKKTTLETYTQGSFDEYMDGTYRTIYADLHYTE